MNYAGKTVLITGGAGYVATAIAAQIANQAGCIRRLHRAGRAPVPLTSTARIEDVTGDVQDHSLWPGLLAGVEVVFHLAAQTSIYVAADNPPADLEANVGSFLRLLETCRQHAWKPHIVLASTVTLYGIHPPLPVAETQADDPVTLYDLHKQMAENYLNHYVRQGTVTGTALRLANVYGPGPRSSRPDRGILNQMVRKALKNEPLSIYGSGDYTRDYVFIDDVAGAFLAAGSHVSPVNGRHFIIGTGTGHTLAHAAQRIAAHVALQTGRLVPIQQVEWPASASPVEKRNFVANPESFRQATGWQAQTGLDAGIDRTVAAFQSETAQQ